MQKVPCQLGTAFYNSFDTRHLATQNPVSSTLKATKCLSLKHNISKSAYGSEGQRDLKAHYTWYSMKMMVSAMEENPDKTSWRLEGLHDWRCNCCYKKKKKNPWKSQTINCCLKNCSGVVHAFSGLGTESVKKIMKETVDIAWKGGRVKSPKIWILEISKS